MAPLFLGGQSVKDFEKQVTEFSLPNGLHFVVVERHQAPVVSFYTYVNAGSLADAAGETGLAYMVARLGYKGTESIGSADWPAEKKALDEVEETYTRLAQEISHWPTVNTTAIDHLRGQINEAAARAQSLARGADYRALIEENGGNVISWGVSPPSAYFAYSLPSNRIELWFLLESERLMHPVFRDFYGERNLQAEDYRKRVESDLDGKLFQELTATAFEASPYRNPPLGWPSDVGNLHGSWAKQFFQAYYIPSNMVMAIVGDVNGAEAKRLAERYFGPMPPRAAPYGLRTQEPAQTGPRTAQVGISGAVAMLVGYKRPARTDKDGPVFDVLQMLLSGGRGGLLQKNLVEERRVAAVVQSLAAYPDARYTNLFTIAIGCAPGHSEEEAEKALTDLLAHLPVTPAALDHAKAQLRAALVRRLADNAGLASAMATSWADWNDWKKMFTILEDIDKVSVEDVHRVAAQYFVPNGRTTVYTAPQQGVEKRQ